MLILEQSHNWVFQHGDIVFQNPLPFPIQITVCYEVMPCGFQGRREWVQVPVKNFFRGL
jgi:hypothetical protein